MYFQYIFKKEYSIVSSRQRAREKDLRYLLTDKQGSTLHKISLMYRGNLSLPRSVMLTHEVQKLMNPASVLFPRYWQNCVELPVWEFKNFSFDIDIFTLVFYVNLKVSHISIFFLIHPKWNFCNNNTNICFQ